MLLLPKPNQSIQNTQSIHNTAHVNVKCGNMWEDSPRSKGRSCRGRASEQFESPKWRDHVRGITRWERRERERGEELLPPISFFSWIVWAVLSGPHLGFAWTFLNLILHDNIQCQMQIHLNLLIFLLFLGSCLWEAKSYTYKSPSYKFILRP